MELEENERIVSVLYDKWQEGGNKGGVHAVRVCPNCGEKRVLFRRTPKGVGICAVCLCAELKGEWLMFTRLYGKLSD